MCRSKGFYWIECCLLWCIIAIGYSTGRLNYSTVPCLQGPNYWCLNETTETLCNFQNKSIGLCGYSNKRCQIKTGKIFFLSIFKRNFAF